MCTGILPVLYQKLAATASLRIGLYLVKYGVRSSVRRQEQTVPIETEVPRTGVRRRAARCMEAQGPTRVDCGARHACHASGDR